MGTKHQIQLPPQLTYPDVWMWPLWQDLHNGHLLSLAVTD
jgi:hypothetical protein